MHKAMTRAEVALFAENLVKTNVVYGVVAKDKQFAWDRISDHKEMVLDYPTTISSPKKYFLPPTETLIEFKLAANPDPKFVNHSQEAILFGMHACDLYATNMLDHAFEDTNKDPNYLEKRKKAILIGVSCMPDPDCFCNKMGVDEEVHNEAKVSKKEALYDIFFKNIGHKYLVSVGTKRGEELLAKYAKPAEATKDELEQLKVVEKKRVESFTNDLKSDVDQLTKLMPKTYNSSVWKEYADKCFACGTCNLVCPTCYCFNITEKVELNLKEGSRDRSWDSCMLPQFAEVAGGENFREHVAERLRHRLMRKGLYIKEKFDKSGCTGCARCYRNCTADISIVEMFNRLKEVTENE